MDDAAKQRAGDGREEPERRVALAAPLVFGGDRDSYRRLLDVWCTLPPGLFGRASLFSMWPSRSALLSNARLAAMIREEIDAALIERIARGADERRILLVATTDLDLYAISERIGYTHYPTFADAYKRQKGKKPSEVEREHLILPLIDDVTSLKAGRGLLDDDAVVRHVEDLLRIYPTAAGRIQIGTCPDPEPLIIVDGARDDRLKAEDLWRKIRDLPFEEQCLRYYETDRAVKTASSEQVRQPIYTSALGKWRRYEKHLGLWQEQLGDVVGDLPDVARNAGL